MSSMRLLIVEDDKDLSDFVREGMLREGFHVDAVADGRVAIEKTDTVDYDVILLDVNLPGLDGFAVLKALRSHGYQGAVILATSKGHEKDKLEGLNNGADDYIVKPYLLTELVARVRAVLRRTAAPSPASKGSLLKAGDLRMDLLKREAKIGNKVLNLTKREFEFLECFMRRPGQVLSHSILNQTLTGANFDSGTNTVEVHIKNLRRKLGSKEGKDLIRTVHGCGYVLDV